MNTEPVDDRTVAERWLVRLGRPVTPEAVDELQPHLGGAQDPNSRAMRAWAYLVRVGKVPSRDAVERVMATDSERSRIRKELDDGAAQRAAAFVASYVEQHGTGPTWNNMFEAMGWSRPAGQTAMALLRNASWLTYTSDPGSLRPGDKFTT